MGARSRLQVSAARGLTRFVGRERDLQLLAQAMEQAGAGHGQAVAVVGEAGVGKSRLVWEFTRSHPTDGWLATKCACPRSGGRLHAIATIQDPAAGQAVLAHLAHGPPRPRCRLCARAFDRP